MTLQRDESSKRKRLSAESAGTISILLSLAGIGLFLGGTPLLAFLDQYDSALYDLADVLWKWFVLSAHVLVPLFSFYALATANSSSKPRQARLSAIGGLLILGGFWISLLWDGMTSVYRLDPEAVW